MRSVRLTIDDMQFIEKNWKKMSYMDIAKSLDRNVASIKKYVEKKVKNNESLEAKAIKIEYDIQSRPFWKEIEQQFEPDELPLFIYHWEKTISQFKDDVLPTEELQIVDMVKMELIMNRLLKQQKTVGNKIIELENLITQEQSKDVDKDHTSINTMNTQLSMLRQAQQTWSREWQMLGDKKLEILKALKATRQERVKNLENSRQTFIGLMVKILEDPETRKKWGVELEKRRLAVEQERIRLSEYHKYEDGVIDQPLFTSETAKDDNILQ